MDQKEPKPPQSPAKQAMAVFDAATEGWAAEEVESELEDLASLLELRLLLDE